MYPSNSQHYLHKDGWFMSPIDFFFNTGNGKVLKKCVYVGEIWLWRKSSVVLIVFGKKSPIFLYHKIDFFFSGDDYSIWTIKKNYPYLNGNFCHLLTLKSSWYRWWTEVGIGCHPLNHHSEWFSFIHDVHQDLHLWQCFHNRDCMVFIQSCHKVRRIQITLVHTQST